MLVKVVSTFNTFFASHRSKLGALAAAVSLSCIASANISTVWSVSASGASDPRAKYSAFDNTICVAVATGSGISVKRYSTAGALLNSAVVTIAGMQGNLRIQPADIAIDSHGNVDILGAYAQVPPNPLFLAQVTPSGTFTVAIPFLVSGQSYLPRYIAVGTNDQIFFEADSTLSNVVSYYVGQAGPLLQNSTIHHALSSGMAPATTIGLQPQCNGLIASGSNAYVCGNVGTSQSTSHMALASFPAATSTTNWSTTFSGMTLNGLSSVDVNTQGIALDSTGVYVCGIAYNNTFAYNGGLLGKAAISTGAVQWLQGYQPPYTIPVYGGFTALSLDGSGKVYACGDSNRYSGSTNTASLVNFSATSGAQLNAAQLGLGKVTYTSILANASGAVTFNYTPDGFYQYNTSLAQLAYVSVPSLPFDQNNPPRCLVFAGTHGDIYGITTQSLIRLL